jgi:hypothetical protein
MADIELWQFFPTDTHWLILDNNGIKTLSSEFFAQNDLSVLDILQFYNNSLTELNRDSFASIPQLTELVIDNSDIIEIPSDLLFGIRKLRYLHFNNNQYLSIIPDCLFRGLPNLIWVFFRSNPLLHSIPERLFAGPSWLDNVSFDNSYILTDGIPNNVFDESHSLITINFYGNPLLSTVKSTWFQNLPLVSYISFNYCPNLQVIEHGAFDTMPNLGTVYFDECDLSAEGIPDDLFVNVDPPVFVHLRDNPRLTEPPPACDLEGVYCYM